MSELKKHIQLVAITGASSGIGKALALEYAKRGHDLIIIARRKNLLDDLKREIESKGKTKVQAIVADLGQIDHLAPLVSQLADHHVDIFINNAGAGYFGYVAQQDPARIASILEVLVVALSYLTAAIGAQMAKRGGGSIVNVASCLAYTSVFPGTAVYAAAKRYVWGFSRAVNYENEMLMNHVRVVSVQPGAIVSDFEQAAKVDLSKPDVKSAMARTPTDDFAMHMVDGLEAGQTDFCYGSGASEMRTMGEKQSVAEYILTLARMVRDFA